MGPLKQLTQPTPGSNEFNPGKVFDPAVAQTLTDLGGNPTLPTAQPNPLTPTQPNPLTPDLAMQAAPGAVPAGQINPVTGDPTAINQNQELIS